MALTHKTEAIWASRKGQRMKPNWITYNSQERTSLVEAEICRFAGLVGNSIKK